MRQYYPSLRACPRWPLLPAAVILLFSGCSTDLNRAISHDNPKAVDHYLASGADVNKRDKDGLTPLIHAAQDGDLALIRRLVELGARVNEVDNDGYSALSCLVTGDTYKNDSVAYLLSHGADAQLANYQGETPLVLAAMRDCKPSDGDRQAELLSLLVGAGAKADKPNGTGDIPLNLASFAGQPNKALDCLVRATKYPHALNNSGYDAFSEAALGDHRDAAIFLAGSGFEPQDLAPAAPPSGAWPPQLDRSLPISARSQYFYGDFLAARGRPADALARYRQSEPSFNAAIAEYNRVIGQYTAALRKEKDDRNERIAGAVALNILGAGLAGATGVGFFVVPKKIPNNIGDYEDELQGEKAELNSLTKERAQVEAKIRSQAP
jgi:ankyrin repeat protein